MTEQTPIEKLRLEVIKHLPNNPDAVFDIMSKANKVTKAKVLEALEEEFDDLMISDCPWYEYKRGREYYETEVKPKYDPEN